MQKIKRLINYFNPAKLPPRIARMRFFIMCSAYSWFATFLGEAIERIHLLLEGYKRLWIMPIIALNIILFVIGGIILPIKRLHDINLSGWWLLWVIILPISTLFLNLISAIAIFIVLLLILYCMAGTKGKNKFGHQPPPPTSSEYWGMIFFIGVYVCVIIFTIVREVLKYKNNV